MIVRSTTGLAYFKVTLVSPEHLRGPPSFLSHECRCFCPGITWPWSKHEDDKLWVPVTVHREQNMKRVDQQDATIRCLLLTSVSTCFSHHYAHLQENKGPVTAFGVLFWFCWMWLVAVVRCCLELNRNLHSDHIVQDSASKPLPTTSSRTRTSHQMQ